MKIKLHSKLATFLSYFQAQWVYIIYFPFYSRILIWENIFYFCLSIMIIDIWHNVMSWIGKIVISFAVMFPESVLIALSGCSGALYSSFQVTIVVHRFMMSTSFWRLLYFNRLLFLGWSFHTSLSNICFSLAIREPSRRSTHSLVFPDTLCRTLPHAITYKNCSIGIARHADYCHYRFLSFKRYF